MTAELTFIEPSLFSSAQLRTERRRLISTTLSYTGKVFVFSPSTARANQPKNHGLEAPTLNHTAHIQPPRLTR